jgi:hypothetical protein
MYLKENKFMYHYSVIAQNGVSSLKTMVMINRMSAKMKKTHILHTLGSSELECSAIMSIPKKSFVATVPWENFNGFNEVEVLSIDKEKELEKRFKKEYNELSSIEKRYLSSMLASLFGDEWVSSFIIIENKNNKVIKKLAEIAKNNKIEVLDLNNKEDYQRIENKIFTNEKQYIKEEKSFLEKLGEKPFKNIVSQLIK